MTMQDSQHHFFGKYQRPCTIFFLVIYYAIFYFSSFLLIYSVITLNIKIMLLLLSISIIQYPFHRSERYIRFLNKYIKPLLYFKSFEVIYQQQIPCEEKCIFGCHPHAVLGVGFLANMNYDERPLSKMICLASRFVLNVPMVGLMLRGWGVEAVHAESVVRLMKEGKNIGILPGGYEEATLTSPSEMRVYIRSRAGFIKYAFAHSYSVYPVIILNEHRAFLTFDRWKSFRLWLNQFKIPAVWYFSWKTLLFLSPYVDLVTVVGRPIQRKRQGDISKEEIQEAHREYINELERIYNKYKHLNGDLPFKVY